MPDIDKQLVAMRFGRRASDYDAVTPVQRSMGEDLLARAIARLGDRPVRSVLELGCGTGGLTARLVQAFPNARIVAVDLASEMVDGVRARGLPVECVVADAEEYVRGHAQRHDLVISNATIQWFADPRGAMTRCLQLLDDGGVLAASTFGSRTFHELAAAFEAAYATLGLPARRHVLPLISAAHWRERLPDADVVERDMVCTYPDVRTFVRSVQAAGASLSLHGRHPIPRRVLAAMQEAYDERFSTTAAADGSPVGAGVRATYHVLMILATERRLGGEHHGREPSP